MYVHRHYHVNHELLKWTILIALAGALVLLAARPTKGDPAELEAVRKPTAVQTARSDERVRNLAPTAKRIWSILELHEQGRFQEAIERWDELSLSGRKKAWRAVGVGTAYLQMGKLDDANCVLVEVHDNELDNPLTRHLLGVVYSTKARVADRTRRIYLADNLRQRARVEFELAVATETRVNLDETLGLPRTRLVGIRRYDTIYPEAMLPPRNPTVGDLLSVLEMKDFATKARVGLAQISMEQGLLDEAETYLDAVAESGAEISDLYTVLGEAYEREGEHMAAARVFLKAARAKAEAGTAQKALRNLRKASPLKLPSIADEAN